MKKLLFILLLLPVLVFSQNMGLNNGAVKIYSTDSTNIIGDLHLSGKIFYEKPHTEWVYKDSAITITGGTNVQITNSHDSLFRELETGMVTYLLGDTGLVLVDAAYNVLFEFRGYGNPGADWTALIAILRDGVTTYSNSVIPFTTTGSNNRNGGFNIVYLELEAGDKIYGVITRDAGTGDIVTTNGQFNIQLYYYK